MKRIRHLLLFLVVIPIIGLIITEITVRLTAFPEGKITPEAREEIEKINRFLVMCRGKSVGNILFWREKLEHVEKAVEQKFIRPYAHGDKETSKRAYDITYSFYGLFGIKGEEIIYNANLDCKHI